MKRVVWIVMAAGLLVFVIFSGQIRQNGMQRSPEPSQTATETHGVIENQAALDAYFTSGHAEGDRMRLVRMSVEGDPITTDIAYTRGEYHVTIDFSRDSFSDGREETFTFKHIGRLTDAQGVRYALWNQETPPARGEVGEGAMEVLHGH